MKLVSAKFIGLKGIYSKSGIKEVFIDFTKCIHNIVLICGKNGSGKSTLIQALTPLPDSPQMYLDREFGMKELVYADGDVMYRIIINYPVYANGERSTTKAFFREIKDGMEIELNENGTLGSFKDILFNKFALDANFASLSRLSIEDRGLVEKRPSERKKYVGNIVESVEVYNSIHKSLVKRSSIFKSMINSITAKIDSVGDEQKLVMECNAVSSRITSLEMEKGLVEPSISEAQAKISLLDPNNSIQASYKNIIRELDELKIKKQGVELSVSTLSARLDIEPLFEVASKKYKQLQSLKNSLEKDIELTEQKVQYFLSSKDEDARTISIRLQKLQAYQSEVNVQDLQNTIKEYRKRLFEYEKIFKKANITNFDISKDEFVIGLNTLNDFRNSVANIKSYASARHIDIVCEHLYNDTTPLSDLQHFQNMAKTIETELAALEKELSYYNGLSAKLDILKGRPGKCNIDSCIFIKDALDAQAQKPLENIDRIRSTIDSLKMDLISTKTHIDDLNDILRIYNEMSILIRSIKNNSAILNKLPNGTIFSDIFTFIERVKNGDQFNDIYELYQYIDYANMFEMHKNDSKVLVDLESQYKAYENKIDTINDLQKEINELNAKIANIDKSIDEVNITLFDKKKALIDISSLIDVCDNLIIKHNEYKEIEQKNIETEMRLSTVSDSIKKIATELERLSELNDKLAKIKVELDPLYDVRDKLRFSINKLDEYKVELAQYNEKYNLVQLVEKYASPTKGIQTIFVKLYMDSTLNMANKLLGLLFEGQLELLPYVIDDNEFRIPCRNSVTSIINDDISSCSSAEKSMISMILGMVLSFQRSTKYNIPSLDEVDAMLDQWNKSQFPKFINSIMSILGIEMCLMVSHSSEIDMTDVDIIQLTPATNDTAKGNVIFRL